MADQLWVRTDGRSLVVGWTRGGDAWRLLVEGAVARPVVDIEPLLRDERPRSGQADVVVTGLSGSLVDPALFGGSERWVYGIDPGSVRPLPGSTTWMLTAQGADCDDPATERRPPRWVSSALGRAVVTVLGPAAVGGRRRQIAALPIDGMSEPAVGAEPPFDARWIWDQQRYRGSLARALQEAELAGRAPRPQPSLKELGELVKSVRGEVSATKLAMAEDLARTSQPLLVLETGSGNVVIAGALPDASWRRVAHQEDAGVLADVDVLAGLATVDDAGWPPARLLEVSSRLAGAVAVRPEVPTWLSPAGAATVVDGGVTELLLVR